MPLPSEIDEQFYALGRQHILAHLRMFLEPMPFAKILEIGPELRWPEFDTLDLKPGSTYQADITKRTPIEDSAYDIVLCMDVLEHTLEPWKAIPELRRITAPGGLLLTGGPLNFRIHGPIPDTFRMTEHGWRVLLKDWDDVVIEPLHAPERVLFPIHYNVSARCNKTKDVPAESLAPWRWLE